MGVGIIDINNASKAIGQSILAVAKLGVSDNGENLKKSFSDCLDQYYADIKSATKGYEDNFKENYSGAKNKIKRFFSSKRRGNLKDFKKSLELDTKNVEDFMKLLGAKSWDLDKKIAIEEKIQKKMEKMPKDNEKQKNEIKLRCYNDMSIKLNINSKRCEICLDRLRDLCKKVGVSQKKAFSVEKVVNKGNKTKISRAGISSETSSYNDAYFGFQDAVDVCRNKIQLAKLKIKKLKETYHIDDIYYIGIDGKMYSYEKDYFGLKLNKIEAIANEAEKEYKKVEEVINGVDPDNDKEKREKLIDDFVKYIRDKGGLRDKKSTIDQETKKFTKGTYKEGSILYHLSGINDMIESLNKREEFIEGFKDYYVLNYNMPDGCYAYFNNGKGKGAVKNGKIPADAPCYSYFKQAPNCLDILKDGKFNVQVSKTGIGGGPYYYILNKDGKWVEGIGSPGSTYKAINGSTDDNRATEEVVICIRNSAERGKFVGTNAE